MRIVVVAVGRVKERPLRAVLDARIDYLSGETPKGTKVAVE